MTGDAVKGGVGAQAFAGLVPGADYATAKNMGSTGGGHFELTIVDEDAKLNVNSVATQAGTVTSEIWWNWNHVTGAVARPHASETPISCATPRETG